MADSEDPATVEQEFEVEDILKYRKEADASEWFLVKWSGYGEDETTWEPLDHMNDNCLELIAKARALWAFSQPQAGVPIDLRLGPVDVEDRNASPEGGQPGVAPALLGGAGSPQDEDDEVSVIEEIDERGYVAPSDMYRRRTTPEPAAAPQPVAKRPRVQAQMPGPPGDTPRDPRRNLPAPPQPLPREEKAVPKELRCVCGVSEKLVGMFNPNTYAVCKICNCALHRTCLQAALGGQRPGEDYVCPPCVLERVDEFHPPVGQGLLRHCYAKNSSTFSLTFNAQAAQWRKSQWAVHLRCVSTRTPGITGPAWPYKASGKMNARPCVAIDPPKHLHVRREQCYNLTPLLRQGMNTLEMKFHAKPDKDGPEDSYCLGVVLTRPRNVASIISRIRSRSVETVSSGRQRVARLISLVAHRDALAQDECKVTGNFGRIMKPLCPVSLCPIEEAAIGKDCQHIQVFDLNAYISVNQRMRSLDKRWTCPVCSLGLRPDDIVLDPFAQGILDTLRGDEDLVEEIVFNEDCSWNTVSAVKEDKERGEEENGGSPAAELIDLSDSE